MKERFQKHINQTFSLAGKQVLVAISGGLDSLVISHLLNKNKVKIILAHCNFQLRGDESNEDENFVRNWAEKLDCPLHVIRFDTQKYASDNGLNTQLAARELRYNWFEKLCDEHNYDYIATAHHADDMWETFVINLSRGTGLKGLCGIPEKNGRIIRPLLPFTREEIKQYSIDNQLVWREDSSNQSDKYIRNRIRHHITPLLGDIHPQFFENFLQTISYLKQNQAFIETQSEQLKSDFFTYSGKQIHINIERIQSLKHLDLILHHWFASYGFNPLEIKQLLQAETGKQLISSTHRMLANRNELIVEPLPEHILNSFQINTVNTITTEPLHLHFQLINEMKHTPNNVHIDADKLNFPLTIRRWQEGDYFYPFGMKGKKKLSKFFKDEKISIYDKEKIWLLCNGNDIVWIIGYRLDNRYAVNESTSHILQIEIKDN